MTQSTQGHTLIISIQLDDSAEDIYYKIDQLTLASGQIPGNGDSAAQIHFDCLDCKTRYFISPQIVKLVKLDTVSELKVSKVKPVDVKKASEPDWLESGSSDEVLTDDEVMYNEKEVPVALSSNKEKQDSNTVVNNGGQNNRQGQKKEISELKKKYYYTCDICKSSIKHRQHLAAHMRIHLGIRYSCSECTKSFSQKSDLVRHKKRFHQNGVRIRIICGQSKTCTKEAYHSRLACLVSRPPKTKPKEEKESNAAVNDNRTQKQYFHLHPVIRLTPIDAGVKDDGQINRQCPKTETSEVEKKYTCDICKSSIKHRRDLIRHMKVIHLGIRVSCSECPKSFSKKSNLLEHKKNLHQSGFRTCELCKWSKTCTKVEYHSHLRRRHPEFQIKGRETKVDNFNGVDFPCIYCEPQVIFKNFEKLKKHLRVTHDRKFPCSNCPKTFNKPSHLNRHIDSVHDKKSEFRICELCKWNKTCTKAKYHLHLRYRHSEFIKQRRQMAQNFNGVDFPCFYCEPQAIFKNFEELKEHLRVTHDRKFPCFSCPKAFNKPSDLNRHIDSIHDKKSEFRICELCKWNKTCTKAKYLLHLRRRHPEFIKQRRQMAQNFNGVDFPCVYCEPQVIFKNYEELNVHLEDTHDRYFTCTQCPKAFNQNHDLNRHIESVHEKKTFSCPKCKKVLMWQSSLKKHLRSHNM